jgi:tetratricopeptide (TPR) repeat protein
MRILGPDGNPIANDEGISDEVREFVQRARHAAEEANDPASGLQQLVFAFQQDVTSDLVIGATVELLTKMAELSGAENTDELELFKQLQANRTDPTLYYQIGNRFCQLQQPFVGRPFLQRARQLVGNQITEFTQAVDVDLAQAAMDLGAYEEAINSFHGLNETYGGLPIWLVLEMAECYALLRQLDEAEAVYEIAPAEAAAQFPGMDMVREEVGDMIARVRDFDEQEDLDLRDWHYVQTRSMLVETNPDENLPGERFVFFQPNEEDVAYIVGVTAAILDKKELAPNKLLWLGPTSEPLARLFAEWWDVDLSNIRAYEPGDNTDSEDELALLVMAHSYDVMHLQDEAAFVDLACARSGLITFALDVRWTERQPMTPDIGGFLSQQCYLPWETRFLVDQENQTVTRVEEERSPYEIATQIGAQFPEAEECEEVADEVLESYEPCTDLIIDHRDGSLNRRPLVTHSPVKSPKIGF